MWLHHSRCLCFVIPRWHFPLARHSSQLEAKQQHQHRVKAFLIPFFPHFPLVIDPLCVSLCQIFPSSPSPVVVSSSTIFHAGSPLHTGWRALGKYFWISSPWEPASFHKEPSHSGRGCVTSRETIICIIRIKGRILLLAKLEKLGWTLIPLETGHLPSLSTDLSSVHSAMHFLLCRFSSLSDLCSCWVCIIF